MAIDLEKIREIYVRQIESWVEMIPADARDYGLVGLADGTGDDISPNQILQHVRQGTDFGNQLLEHTIALAAAEATTAFESPAMSTHPLLAAPTLERTSSRPDSVPPGGSILRSQSSGQFRVK